MKITPSKERMAQLSAEMKRLAEKRGMTISDLEAEMEAEKFLEYIALGFRVMKKMATNGQLPDDVAMAYRLLAPFL